MPTPTSPASFYCIWLKNGKTNKKNAPGAPTPRAYRSACLEWTQYRPAGEEATLKRVYYDGSTITLVPVNSAYRPKMYSRPALDDIQIEGLVTGYTHWF
ncbi:LexA family protein [Gemmiger sp.]|uniref:LexA family protein n=1 Tax=Gemmiger sp. TaxID=2049027 RepID=UPI003A8FF168